MERVGLTFPAIHSKPVIFRMLGAKRMWDTCAVELRLQLPRAVAAEVEEVARRDPEVLSRILLYGLTRRAVFEQLAKAEGLDES